MGVNWIAHCLTCNEYNKLARRRWPTLRWHEVQYNMFRIWHRGHKVERLSDCGGSGARYCSIKYGQIVRKVIHPMYISLIEYGVQNYPEGMEHWRMYRIEYGGHAERCLVEGVIWLPEDFEPAAFERYLTAISAYTSGKPESHEGSDK